MRQDWKTTLTPIATLVVAGLAKYGLDVPTELVLAILALGFVVLGWFAKDKARTLGALLLIGALTLAAAGDLQATAGQNMPQPVNIATPGTGNQYTTVKTAYLDSTSTGDNTVVSAVSGKKIVVWMFEVAAGAASNVAWKSGSTQISQTVYLAQYGGWVRESARTYYDVVPALVTAAGAALVINASGQPFGVWVVYTEE